MVKKRGRLEIIKDILSVINSNRSIKPTQLLRKSNLSPQMFKEYISELQQKELINLEQKGKDKYYTLTSKGFQFLEKYRTIENFISSFGL